MSISNHHPDNDIPWYRLKSTILMVSVTLIAAAGVTHDAMTTDQSGPSGVRIIEDGRIINRTGDVPG